MSTKTLSTTATLVMIASAVPVEGKRGDATAAAIGVTAAGLIIVIIGAYLVFIVSKRSRQATLSQNGVDVEARAYTISEPLDIKGYRSASRKGLRPLRLASISSTTTNVSHSTTMLPKSLARPPPARLVNPTRATSKHSAVRPLTLPGLVNSRTNSKASGAKGKVPVAPPSPCRPSTYHQRAAGSSSGSGSPTFGGLGTQANPKATFKQFLSAFGYSATPVVKQDPVGGEVELSRFSKFWVSPRAAPAVPTKHTDA